MAIAPDDGLPKEPTEVLTHSDEAVTLFIEEFKNLPRLDALIRAFADQVQELETALFEVFVERTISLAVGTQLDVLGVIAGQGRQGQLDADYRTLIRARIKVNRSNGKPDELLEILRLVLSGTPEITIVEYYPASVHLCLLTELSEDADLINSLLQAAKSAGVLLVFKFTLKSKATTFRFAPGSVVVIDASLGFADETQTSGGYLAGARS